MCQQRLRHALHWAMRMGVAAGDRQREGFEGGLRRCLLAQPSGHRACWRMEQPVSLDRPDSRRKKKVSTRHRGRRGGEGGGITFVPRSRVDADTSPLLWRTPACWAVFPRLETQAAASTADAWKSGAPEGGDCRTGHGCAVTRCGENHTAAPAAPAAGGGAAAATRPGGGLGGEADAIGHLPAVHVQVEHAQQWSAMVEWSGKIFCT